jgi:hypothetical protein
MDAGTAGTRQALCHLSYIFHRQAQMRYLLLIWETTSGRALCATHAQGFLPPLSPRHGA